MNRIGGDLVSTWVVKPEVHAEVHDSSLNCLATTLSCER